MNESIPTPSLERWQLLVVPLAELMFGWQRWMCCDHPHEAALFPAKSCPASWQLCDPEIPLSPTGWTLAALHLPPTPETIWRAEERLSAEQRRLYAHKLHLLIGDEELRGTDDFDLLHASVERRAVALLLVFGVDLREARA